MRITVFGGKRQKETYYSEKISVIILDNFSEISIVWGLYHLYKVDNNYDLHKKIPVIVPSCFSLDKPSSTNRQPQPQQQSMSSSVILKIAFSFLVTA